MKDKVINIILVTLSLVSLVISLVQIGNGRILEAQTTLLTCVMLFCLFQFKEQLILKRKVHSLLIMQAQKQQEKAD